MQRSGILISLAIWLERSEPLHINGAKNEIYRGLSQPCARLETSLSQPSTKLLPSGDFPSLEDYPVRASPRGEPKAHMLFGIPSHQREVVVDQVVTERPEELIANFLGRDQLNS
jgi:hypothetical protein